MKYLKTILMALCISILQAAANAQLTLNECHQLAWENYPLLKKYKLIEQTTDYTIKNINRDYLPQLNFSSKASIQSETSELPDMLKNMLQDNGYNYKGVDNDQYRISLDVDQVIWDGGNLEAQKKVADMDGKVKTAQNNVDMYALRERVNELFFGLLLLEEKIKLNLELQKLLLDNQRKVENRVTHGEAMKADTDLIKAEYLQVRQEMITLESIKKSYQQMLAIFINKDSASINELQKPEASMPESYENKRPELELYQTQMKQTEAQKKLLNAGIRPKLSLFAQGNYSYPSYDTFGNMFDHDLQAEGIAGIRLIWNIEKLFTHRNDKKKLELARQEIEATQETFLFNNRMQLTQETEAIDQYRKMMEQDDAIITLRTSVREAAESKLEHGVIDINDLIQEITRENQARIDHSFHEIEMLKNIYELRNTINQ